MLNIFQEHESCMVRIRDNYAQGILLDTKHGSDGNQQKKLSHRLDFIVLCRDEALDAFNIFLKNADKDTARQAALFLRASQLLSQKNSDIISPWIQKALKAERKKVRPFLRNYMINFGQPELRDLKVRQYSCTHLCDSDQEEEGQEALNVKKLKDIMKVDIPYNDELKEDSEDSGDDTIHGSIHRSIPDIIHDTILDTSDGNIAGSILLNGDGAFDGHSEIDVDGQIK